MSSSDFLGIFIFFVLVLIFIAGVAATQDTPEKKAKREQEERKAKEAASRRRLLLAATSSSEDPGVRAKARQVIMSNPTQSELLSLKNAGDISALHILKRQEYFVAGRSTTASCLSLLRDGSLSRADRLSIVYSVVQSHHWDGTLSELKEAERLITHFPVSEQDVYICANFIRAIQESIVQKRFEQIRDGK